MDEQVNPNMPGFVFTVSTKGFRVLHPDSPTFIIDLQYSQLYLRGQQPLSLESELEPFFNSLMFTPLR